MADSERSVNGQPKVVSDRWTGWLVLCCIARARLRQSVLSGDSAAVTFQVKLPPEG
jgi:hypothetical protein